MIKRNPSVLLLVFVYLCILPRCLSYQNAWQEPEQRFIKSCLLTTGTSLNLKDINNGLSWQCFEQRPRSTRPLASYFEILDTKFRCWLWHYIMPHPSLSLTWIFSLVLAPLFLYRLLRNLNISPNVAMAMTAFYLATPGVLSFEVMLFRPAKPMTNFSIIWCAWLASNLKKKFLDRNEQVPWGDFLVFWAVAACSLFWDETAVLIFPAMGVMFPSLFKRRSFLVLWGLLPLVALSGYLEIIPWLTAKAGHGWPNLFHYDLVQSIKRPDIIHNFFNFFAVNSRNLVLDTMGLFPWSLTTSCLFGASIVLAVVSWAVVLFFIWRSPKPALSREEWPGLLFLVFLLFVFDAMLSVTMLAWGPYYYGAFWSVFFVFFIASPIEKAKLPKWLLACCFFLIINSTTVFFTGINAVYKKFHWYPWRPSLIEDYFQGARPLDGPQAAPVFSGGEIKKAISRYWRQVRDKTTGPAFSLPRELTWLPIELEPEKRYERFAPAGSPNFNMFTVPGLAVFYNDRGNASFSKGQWPQAVFNYGKAVEFDPLWEDVYYNLGLAYYKQREFSQAAASFEKAVGLKSDDAQIYNDLAVIYYQLKEYDKAWGSLRKMEALGVKASPQLINALNQVKSPNAF